MALLARFIHIGYVEDLDEVLMLIHEVITGQRHPAILDVRPGLSHIRSQCAYMVSSSEKSYHGARCYHR